MHNFCHYRCIMNLGMSSLNYICATPTEPHPTPCLINIEGNSSSNNVLLTVHALLLRGGLTPCILASQTHTQTFPRWDSVGERKKKRKRKKHNTRLLIRAVQPTRSALGAPDRSSDVWGSGNPEFVHHWLVKTPLHPAQLQLMCLFVDLDTNLEQHYYFFLP